jgi:hypothetical protein
VGRVPSLCLALALAASAAQAEPPRISLVFGPDALSAQANDIRAIRRVDRGASGSALVIRLAPGFDALMTALTAAHVGETGRLLICGETVLEPQIHARITRAEFVLSDTDPTRIDRLHALLTGPTCDTAPDS